MLLLIRLCDESNFQSRPPRPPLHRLDNLLRVQVPDVPIRRRQARMPQLLLNDVQRLPFVRQFKGMRVPQAVGMDPLFDSDLPPEPMKQVAYIRGPERFAGQGAKQRMPAVQADPCPPFDPLPD